MAVVAQNPAVRRDAAAKNVMSSAVPFANAKGSVIGNGTLQETAEDDLELVDGYANENDSDTGNDNDNDES